MSVAEASVLERVEHYLSLPYRIELIPDIEEGGYAVSIPELPGCLSQGESAEEALAMIRDAQRGWLTAAVRHGDPIPVPRSHYSNGGRPGQG